MTKVGLADCLKIRRQSSAWQTDSVAKLDKISRNATPVSCLETSLVSPEQVLPEWGAKLKVRSLQPHHQQRHRRVEFTFIHCSPRWWDDGK
jgi:hypothetical protein